MAVLWNLSWAGLGCCPMPLAGPLEHVTLQTGSASLQLPAGGGLGASSKGGTLVQIGAKSQKQVAAQSAFSCAWGYPWSHRHCDGTWENGAAWPALRAGGGQ